MAKILVIADDPYLRCTLAVMLHHAGYSVDTAESTIAALEILRIRTYDLLLVDVDSPGINSRLFIAAQQALLPETPVILLASALPRKAPPQYHFLLKPIDPTTILQHVRSALRLPA
ncbi:MAG: response regulator [Chloroflexi bacterium]|nr:response regulator [Chloroflexota bacterium]